MNKGTTSRRLILLALLGLQLTVASQPRLLLGGDLSLLPSYQQAGTVYKDYDGQAVSLLPFLHQEGWNAVRVRLFVNPDNAPQKHKGEGACQSLSYILPLCQQIKQAGMQLMLDFHYSDYWADPGKQTIPQEWQGSTLEQLCDHVYRHTRTSLLALKAAGAEPELIQVGNEITNGMLWPVARLVPTEDEGWDRLCALIAAGCQACREVCPESRIIIHTEKAGSWPVTAAYYEQLHRRNIDYDVIGLSYYPMWHKSIPNLGQTLDSLQRYFPHKEVMIVETAAYYSHENDPWATPDQYAEFYPITVEGQAQFTRELVRELSRHRNVTGLFWWFAEENAYCPPAPAELAGRPQRSSGDVVKAWLNRGLFSNRTGRALPALQELKKYRPEAASTAKY